MSFIVGGIAIGGFAVYQVVKNYKEKRETAEKLAGETEVFINEVLNDKIVFKKMTRTGIFSNRYRGVRNNHIIEVSLASNQLTIKYYIKLYNDKLELVYDYLYDRDKKIGQKMHEHQLIKNDITFETLFKRLENKMVNYNFENPLTYYAKKTMNLVSEVDKLGFSKEEKNDKNPLIESIIKDIDEIYIKIKADMDKHGSFEEKHNFERLYHKDFDNLKVSYYNIYERSQQDDITMLEGLGNLKNQLKNMSEKIDLIKKTELEKNKEVIIKRDK